MKNFEMAHSDDPPEIVMATQRSIIASMKYVIKHLKDDIGGPGLTWEQIDHFLNEFEKKKPIIIEQS